MCIIGHYGNGMLDADGDGGGDRLPGRYVVSWDNFLWSLNLKHCTAECAVSFD